MVGLGGTIDEDSGTQERIRADLGWTGEEIEQTHDGDRVTVSAVTHAFRSEPQPAAAGGDAELWIWGSIWGFDRPDGGYEVATESPAAYCASLYEEYGIEFVSGLNGTFVGLVYDRSDRTVTLFTDRLGTRPLHYALTDDGVVFSTNPQSLPVHPAVPAAFDVESLAEYFTLQRSFGVTTPLEGVAQLRPGSTLAVSLEDGGVDERRYWKPSYDPRSRSPTYFAKRIAERLREVAEERTRPDGEYGLMLSGGSDSRLILAALTAADRDVRAFHMNDWHNVEAEITRRVAETAGVPITFLRRDRDYQARALSSVPRIATFNGYFNQLHAGGFADRLSDAVDVLFTGHYGDILFKGDHLPTRTVDLGPVGSFEVPFERTLSSVDEFADYRTTETPAYISGALDRSVRDIYRANVTPRGDGLVDHGIEYDTLEEALLFGRCPFTNSSSHFFYYGTLQMMPSGTLFLDNRLLELFQRVPRRYFHRGNLIGRAIEMLDSDLAAIPHASTGTSLSSPFPVQWAGEVATAFKRRYVDRSPAKAHWTHGAWPDHNELIRTHPFVRDTLEEHESTIRALPFLDAAGVDRCYEEHLDGGANLGPLYTLATFLNMPVTQYIADRTA